MAGSQSMGRTTCMHLIQQQAGSLTDSSRTTAAVVARNSEQNAEGCKPTVASSNDSRYCGCSRKQTHP
jgi:hypothetical protein